MRVRRSPRGLGGRPESLQRLGRFSAKWTVSGWHIKRSDPAGIIPLCERLATRVYHRIRSSTCLTFAEVRLRERGCQKTPG